MTLFGLLFFLNWIKKISGIFLGEVGLLVNEKKTKYTVTRRGRVPKFTKWRCTLRQPKNLNMGKYMLLWVNNWWVNN